MNEQITRSKHRLFWLERGSALPEFHYPDALRAMRHPNFRLFFWGQLISLIGTWMQSTAQQWLVYRITGSQTSLGMVTFIGFLPVLVFSLFMGVLVDQLPKRRVIVLTQAWFMLLAGVLAALTWWNVVQYWHILVLAFLLGLGNALDMPARQAFVVDMVDNNRADLMNAIGLNSSLFNGARIVGPAIAGILVAITGEAPAFAINSITFLAVIFGLLLMKLPPYMAPQQRGLKFAALKQGLSYIYHDKTIFGLVTMIAAFSTFGFSYLTLLPVYARDILNIGADGFGKLMSAQGVGALAGALVLTVMGDRLPKGKMLLMGRSLLGFAVLGFALSRTLWLSLLFLALAGYAFITQLTFTNTMIQLIAPDSLRGRVISAYTWALGGFFPLGSLLIGFIGDQIGTVNATLVCAGSSIVLTLLNLLFFPTMKNLG
ncbi:MAG: MFS transporter [Anaerolineales bacterium]